MLFFPGRYFTFSVQTMGKLFLFKGSSKLITEAYNPVDTRRRFNAYKTSIRRRRRRIDVL